MSAVEMRELVTEWLTSPDTCFLVGAGCSKSANKPLIAELTTIALGKLGAPINDEFKELNTIDGRGPTIEDLINYLVRYKAILSTVSDPAKHKLVPDWIDQAIRDIKREIVAAIVDDWQSSPVHARLFTRITRQKGLIDIFSLNYDTLIEATLDSLRISYIDGFRGSNRGWFDPTIFDDASGNAGIVRVYKMHGSINWIREKSGHVRRVIVRKVDDLTDDPVVIFPSEQKYLQTQYGIYETMLNRFRARLRSNRANARLVTLGYSFNDEHINEAIVDAVLSPGSNLTVVAFVGPDVDLVAQEKRLRAIGQRCDDRFNGYIGNSLALGAALPPDETAALLKQELWKFESLVDFVAGPAP